MRLWQRLIGVVAVAVLAVALVPSAMASVSGSESLDQSAGTSAGGFHNLGLTLSFSDSGTDSPRDLTLNLPPGLLANAAVDGGQCLRANQTPSSACAIGSGTVTAKPNVTLAQPILGGGVSVPSSVPVQVTFYLVPPPQAGDLAGIEVYGLGEQIGQTGQIAIRPSGSSDGVGATVALVLPNTLPSSVLPAPLPSLVGSTVGISIQKIQSTFTSLRYPATCPSSPAPFTASFDSYQGGGTQTVSAPLAVTDCGALPYNPQFSAAATKDSGDDAVAVTTNITQAANESPNRSVSLAFPTNVFAPNLRALSQLCTGSVSGCSPVGSVAATSPLYPSTLTGSAYLTGTGQGLSLTLTFPQPFPLTLVGSVSLLSNTAAFSGLPDIPLTALKVTLNGGSKGLFATGCRPPSGTAVAHLGDQNGDRSAAVSSAFGVVGCPGVSSGSTGGEPGSTGSSGSGGSSGGSTGGSGSAGTSTSSSTPSAAVGGTQLRADPIAGLRDGKPSVRFTVSTSRHAAKFTRLTVSLPSGLSIRTHTVRRREQKTHKVVKRTVIRGVSMKGGRIRSLRLTHHRLLIVMRGASRRTTVTLGSASLRESRHLRLLAEHKRLKRLRLKVAVRDTRHRTRTLTVTVRHFRL